MDRDASKAGSPPQRRRIETLISAFRGCRRQSTVELALVLPVLVLVIFGCLKVGAAFLSYEQVTSAANAEARAAAVNHETDPTAAARPIRRASRLSG